MAKRLCTPKRNRMTDQLEMVCISRSQPQHSEGRTHINDTTVTSMFGVTVRAVRGVHCRSVVQYCKCPSRMGWFSEPYPRLRLEIIDQAGMYATVATARLSGPFVRWLVGSGNPFPLCVAPEEYVIEIRRPFGFCTGVLGIERGESLPVAVILGMTFLRSYYVIFDLTDPQQNRMGFVRSAASVLPADAACPVEKEYLEPGSLARMAHRILMNLALWVFIVVGLAAAAWWLFMKARRHYK